jgi:glucose-fructose oxidoreductase
VSDRIRFAVVGLGHIGRSAIIPAFTAAPSAELVTVISGDPAKRQEICSQYHLGAGYAYHELERGLLEQKCDAVFIAVPNQQHREYTERCLAAGVNVLCEKPLAVTSEDCLLMKEAAERARKKLMVAYRHHFSDSYRELLRFAQNGTIGELRSVHSIFTISVKEGSHKTLRGNGGTLPDIGIYCINTIRNIMREEPVSVAGFATARSDDARFREIEEMFTAVMEFPGARLATFTCEFGASRVMSIDVVGTAGSIHAEPFYDYKNDVRMEINVDGMEKQVRVFPKQNQFALEIEYFAQCVLNGTEPAESASEAFADARIIEALHDAAKPVSRASA